ncbi:hypothetical protein CVT25_015340 [Psilocybe cyanescens]|uniref:F-box domain-containing protein n=1 Tax=Psilocybe cyanescens TaxID=93625 RepID=A0A409WH82_PSICY|nr:hypothetical protein CVT25_015340 [Psilocybe cyanescens]
MNSRPTSPAPTTTSSSSSCPISLLSAELLTLILDLVLTSAYENDVFACGPDDDSVARAARLTASLAHVCAFWRAVVRGNPLWHDTLSLVPPWWHLDLERGLERVCVLLARSAQVPLDLRIFGHADYTTSRSSPATAARMSSGSSNSDSEHLDAVPMWAEYKPLFELLAPHLPRCRALQIRGVFTKDNDIPFHLLESLLDMDMPLLETFIFEGELSYYDDYMTLRGPKPLFRSAPRLQQLRMVGIGINRFTIPSSSSSSTSFESLSLSPSPSSSTLTTLHLSRASSRDHTSFSDLLRVLASSPLLHTLAIYDEVLQRFPGPQAYGTCPAPALDTLFILGNMLSVSELLLFLDAPKLRELVIAPLVPSDLSLLMAVREEEERRRPSSSGINRVSGSGSGAPTSSVSAARFKNLTTLTLAPAHPEAFDAVSSASTCFPFVMHLVLANVYLEPFKQLFCGGLGAHDTGMDDGRVVYSSDEEDGGLGAEDDDELHGGGEWGVDDPARRDGPGAGAGVYVARALSRATMNADAGADISMPVFGDAHTDSDTDTEGDPGNNPNPITHNSNGAIHNGAAHNDAASEQWKTLFPHMLDIALTDVNAGFAQAICDMQVLRGFAFEAARVRGRGGGAGSTATRAGIGNANANANGTGTGNSSSSSSDATNNTPATPYRSRHTAKWRRLSARTRGAGCVCVPLQSVYLDARSYEVMRTQGAFVWNDWAYYGSEGESGDCGDADADADEGEYHYDGEGNQLVRSTTKTNLNPKKKKKEITDFERYVQRADMWEARRKTALFAQVKDLYVGQLGHDD